ncbi:PfkB family carbohydrate kinase, partial [Staphylococcus aureus]|uniref:PfkB family carbohydrate kinase n=1 Tax=Staphylococcus aureus TaxID=1280 RepID=UPI000A88E8CE
WVDELLDSVFNDTLPHVIKTGVIATADTMETIRHYLMQHEAIPYVIDPVMVAKSGASLMDNHTKQNLTHTLLPFADVVTPNLPEADEITGLTIDSVEKIMQAGRIFINDIGSKGVILKGGHSNDT